LVIFNIKDDKNLAREAILEAGKIAKKYFSKEIKQWDKSPNNPVTEVDYAVNDSLALSLRNNRISYGWLSEESEDDSQRLNKNYVWTIDPIDGTKAFIEKKPEFTISIALVHDSKPILGLVYNPITEELFEAEIGNGSYLNGKKIQVSNNTSLSRGNFLGGKKFLSNKKNIFSHAKFSFIGSIAYRMALVAKGEYDGTITLSNKSDWDIAAGNLIVEEAGGKVTMKNGEGIQYNKKNILHPNLIVANSVIHRKIIDLIK
tara:strand:+ start:4631 stop:5407 length:777 start_codon:yes stop_codon:yes gene_type:complete